MRQSPLETAENGIYCSVCTRPLTLGVLHRINSLSSEILTSTLDFDGDARGFIRSTGNRTPFARLIPLQEIIADLFGQGVNTKRVQREYLRLVNEFGNELTVLLHASPVDLALVTGDELADGIMRARLGQVQVVPGYDGEYGKICISATNDRA